MSSRDVVLARVREALSDVSGAADEVPVEWAYGAPTALDEPVLDRFVERVEDYRAVVERCGADEVPARVAAALAHYGATSLVRPPGLDDAWLTQLDGVEVIEDSALTPLQLNEIDAVVTACAVGVAETGTIVLDHADDQGRRALSLVPDIHVCVVAADQVVSDVPEAITRLGDAATSHRPMTFISGPSATSDIELSRVEGVHGPRTLHVIVTE